MSQKYYVTTPIYYVNDVPHIGHSYTTIAADVLARYWRAEGRDVRFLTGTDEHGIKIVQAAREKGMTPRELADEVVVHFQELWRRLNISNDDFIRTSQPRHEKRVQALVARLIERDEIYPGQYEGWYDEGQEEFVTESAARETDYKSAISGRPLVRYSEPGYFFRLGKWVPRLIEHIEAHPGFILPEVRRNEVLSKLAQGVEDLSISRLLAKLGGWGVPMPNDPAHSVYVWIDALSNYITALGLPEIGDGSTRSTGLACSWPWRYRCPSASSPTAGGPRRARRCPRRWAISSRARRSKKSARSIPRTAVGFFRAGRGFLPPDAPGAVQQ